MIRRVVVTSCEGGKAIIASDTELDDGAFVAIPGFAVATIWGTQDVPKAAEAPTDPPTVLPPRGGSRFMIVSFPPDSVFADASFDGAAAGAEQGARLGNLAAAFEPDAPGMHRTDTLDYAIVLSGTPVLEVDDDLALPLAPGDTVVQQATRHAWRNPGRVPATVAFVMLGNENAPPA